MCACTLEGKIEYDKHFCRLKCHPRSCTCPPLMYNARMEDASRTCIFAMGNQIVWIHRMSFVITMAQKEELQMHLWLTDITHESPSQQKITSVWDINVKLVNALMSIL